MNVELKKPFAFIRSTLLCVETSSRVSSEQLPSIEAKPVLGKCRDLALRSSCPRYSLFLFFVGMCTSTREYII